MYDLYTPTLKIFFASLQRHRIRPEILITHHYFEISLAQLQNIAPEFRPQTPD